MLELAGKRHCFARSLLRFRNAAAAARSGRCENNSNPTPMYNQRQDKQNIQPEERVGWWFGARMAEDLAAAEHRRSAVDGRNSDEDPKRRRTQRARAFPAKFSNA